ncbi:MAG TPA: TIGR02266 family protein [Myxococcaceae bacterium]|nr:TIGR02266 family protein [Myxococcaceae bacterium]
MSADEGDAGPQGEDRRQHERVTAHIEVRFGRADEAARALRAYSLNFSVGGLCLKTQRPYELGERLSLSMTIEGREVECLGVVAWVRSGVAIGVRFEEVKDADRALLQQMVKALTSRT